MELHPLRPEDKVWIDPIVMAEETHSSDFSFGSLMLWNDPGVVRAGKLDERLIVCSKLHGIRFFLSPIGSGPVAPAVLAIKEACDREGVPMRIYGVTEENRAQMEEELPGMLAYKDETDYADYVYETDKLADLPGSRLHAKRNHINKFLSLYPDWHYEPISPEYFDLCIELLQTWQAGHETGEKNQEILSEQNAIDRAFRYYAQLGLEGGVLFAGKKLCAFTIGEQCTRDTLVVHFEKADVQVEGAFTMINREFARQVRDRHPEIRYINRSDDIGLASLRKAKQSYHPFCLVKKYTVTWQQ